MANFESETCVLTFLRASKFVFRPNFKRIIWFNVEFGFSNRMRIQILDSVEFGTELFGQNEFETNLKRTEFKFVRDYCSPNLRP